MVMSHASLGQGKSTSLVSGRFLTDFFLVLDRHGVSTADLLGDLPIPRSETGEIADRVEWSIFAEFLQRLERSLGGAEGIETCGRMLGELRQAGPLRSLRGLMTSPFALYRGAIQWALRRALPGLETRIAVASDNRIEIHAALAEGLRPCPQIFHFVTGGARALPGLLGLPDAVVDAEIRESDATYRIALPPSLTLFARLRRMLRSLFSAGSVLQFLESQQLELHAQHDALQRAHDALAASERRYRALTDAAVDVLCEIDRAGRVIYVSPSIRDLIGYSPEQVGGSHYHLWVPQALHPIVDARFQALASRPAGTALTNEVVSLHAGRGERLVAEISVRSYETSEGEWRLVGILRDVSHRFVDENEPRPESSATIEHSTIAGLHAAISKLPAGTSPASRRTSARTSQGHALEHSLEALLASLESFDREMDAGAEERLSRASRRMAQIVNAACARADEATSRPQWIETLKLVEVLRMGFAASHGDRALELEVRTDEAAVQIWGCMELLASGIGSLLDHAAERAGAGSRVVLEVRRPTNAPSDSGIELQVRVRPCEMDPESPKSAVAGDSEAGALALEIARDVASAIGGELLQGDALPRMSEVGLRIPQPDPPAAERRDR